MTNPTEKRAPVQGYPGGIPWAIHLEAYEVYCKRYGAQPALIDLEGRNCRGGFGTGELDQFIPGWRDRVTEFGLLKTKVAEQAARLDDYATEINRLRNVIQAACTGGTDYMIERWKALFPDEPVPSVKKPDPFDVTLDEDAVKLLRDTIVIGDDEDDVAPIRLVVGDGHSGHGLYLAQAEYQDEGAVLLTPTRLA